LQLQFVQADGLEAGDVLARFDQCRADVQVRHRDVMDEWTLHEHSFPARPVVDLDPEVIGLRRRAVGRMALSNSELIVTLVAVEAGDGDRPVFEAEMRHAGDGCGQDPMRAEADC
jgi:hypothetical protein